MSKKKQQDRTRDEMDGAVFLMARDRGGTPADYMNGPDGKRKDSPNKEPWGYILAKLDDGIEDKTLPPRFIWAKGKWKTVEATTQSDDWNTWIVSGEGTPGNYQERHYLLPDEMAKENIPPHPADWPESLKKTKHTWKGKATASSGLPFGILIRCLGCGHFYKMSNISDHARTACPGVQDPPVLWLMVCECHEDDPQTAATVLPGFPYKAPEVEEKETLVEDLQEEAAAKAPDAVRGEPGTLGY